jgi:hypothetical protein
MENERTVYVQGDVSKEPTSARWCVTNAPTLQQTLLSAGWHIADESEIQQLEMAGVRLGVPGFEGIYGQNLAADMTKDIPRAARG